MNDIEQFRKDRAEALSDPKKLAAYCKKYGIKLAEHPESRERAIHKARTACTDLPVEMRKESKRILDSKGSESWDDGDL